MFRDFHFVQKWNKVKIKAKIKSSNHQKLNYYWWNVYKCYFATLLLSLLCFRMTGAPSLALTSPTHGRSSLALAPSTGLLSWSDVRCQITFLEERRKISPIFYKAPPLYPLWTHTWLDQDQARNQFPHRTRSWFWVQQSAVIAIKYLKRTGPAKNKNSQDAGHCPDLLWMQPPHRGPVHHAGWGQHPPWTLPQVRYLPRKWGVRKSDENILQSECLWHS